ncbi:MAG: hypothetical protein WA220_04685 [Candidatus Nitrosopolaris sp.]
MTSPCLMILMKAKITNDKSKMILGSSKLFCYNPANKNYDNTVITFFASKAIAFFSLPIQAKASSAWTTLMYSM